MGQASGNLIQGDYIGITRGGVAAGNSGNGVMIQGASSNTIGGTSTGARNVISANGGAGILLVGGSGGTPATANLIQGNDIGTNTSGLASSSPPLGNFDGVSIQSGASNNTIGAVTSGSTIGGTIKLDPASNTIGGNTHDGVVITSTNAGATGNRISQNLVFDNANMGIDLGDDGITAPRRHIGESGPTPDNWQSYPLISSITTTGRGAEHLFFCPGSR